YSRCRTLYWSVASPIPKRMPVLSRQTVLLVSAQMLVRKLQLPQCVARQLRLRPWHHCLFPPAMNRLTTLRVRLADAEMFGWCRLRPDRYRCISFVFWMPLVCALDDMRAFCITSARME